jgi:hypothetical protein
MKLPVIRRILREDLAKSGELPGWIDQLLVPLNQFIDQITLAIRNNLTLQDNVAGKYISTLFAHNVELQINPLSQRKVIGIIPLDSSGHPIDRFNWGRKANGNIGITFYFSDAPAGNVTCTVFLFFGGA